MNTHRSTPATSSSSGDQNDPPLARVVPAVLTPCSAPGQVDPEAMHRLVQQLVQHGCDGVFVPSSTGELPLLDGDDRRLLIEAAVAAAGDAAPVYSGVAGTGLKQSIRYAREAGDAGARMAVAMVPYFLKLEDGAMQAYFRQLADASPIPLGLYQHHKMPSEISLDTVAALADHPNIVAIKDTNQEGQRTQALRQALGGATWAVLQGREPFILASLRDGAHGCISALANMAPEWHRRLVDAWFSGDEPTAIAMQERIAGLCELFTLPDAKRSTIHFVYVIRRGVQQRGWLDRTDELMPGFDPDPHFVEAIDRVLIQSGLITEQVR